MAALQRGPKWTAEPVGDFWRFRNNTGADATAVTFTSNSWGIVHTEALIKRGTAVQCRTFMGGTMAALAATEVEVTWAEGLEPFTIPLPPT